MGHARRLNWCGAASAALAFAVHPGAAVAECSTASTAARCIAAGDPDRAAERPVGKRVKAPQVAPRFQPGDVLPPGRYLRMLNSGYYGLPPVEGDWRYYEVEGRILRVRPDTLEVIGDATAEANGAF